MDINLILGRGKDSTIIFNNKKISGNHALLTRRDNVFMIKDLDSVNGTFKNGRRIKSSRIQKGDSLRLADQEVDFELLSESLDSLDNKKKYLYEDVLNFKTKIHEAIVIRDKFLSMEKVYKDYFEAKKNIRKNDMLKKTGMRAGLSMIPFVGIALGQLSQNIGENIQIKLMELDEAHKHNYVCPKCYRYLAEPFENLKNRGFCVSCKTKWLELPKL